MQIVKIIGIIALIVFLLAYIGRRCIKWFFLCGDKWEKVEDILDGIEVASLTIGAVCGIIHLFV